MNKNKNKNFSTNNKMKIKTKANPLNSERSYFFREENSKTWTFFFLTILSNPVLANRLQAAAERGKAEIIPMAQTAAVIGIVVGGFLMSIGASHVGRGILLSALVGAAAIFGGPALIEVVRSIFGS